MHFFNKSKYEIYDAHLMGLVDELESSLQRHPDIDFHQVQKDLHNEKASDMVKGSSILWLNRDIQSAVREGRLILDDRQAHLLSQINDINSPNSSPYVGTRIFW